MISTKCSGVASVGILRQNPRRLSKNIAITLLVHTLRNLSLKDCYALEKNWNGPLLNNKQVSQTLALFQKLEKSATPQEKLNWRFQQALYRAYYDAYIQARLIYETELERQALKLLKATDEATSLTVIDQAEALLDKAATAKVSPELRARVFELAEALFQSIRMQLSVEKYQAIAVGRGANLDEIDKPLNHSVELKKRLGANSPTPTAAERVKELLQLAE